MHNPLDRWDEGLRRAAGAPLSKTWRIAWTVLFSVIAWGLLCWRFSSIAEGQAAYVAPALATLYALLFAATLALVQRQLARAGAGALATLLFCGVVLAVYALRIVMLPHQSGDYEVYLQPWIEVMRQFSFGAAFSRNITDYNVPYEYLIFLFSRLPLPSLYLYKWFSMAADILAALLVMQIALRLGKRGPLGGLLSFLLVLCWPTFVLNSAMWAQCDVLYATLALAGVYFALTDRPYLSAAAFSLSLAFKLQAIFLLPMMLVLFMTGKLRLKHLLAFVCVYALTMVPALLGGMPLSRVFMIYVNQAQNYKSLVMGAPTLFQFMNPPPGQTFMFTYFGIALGLTATLALCAFLIARRDRLDAPRILDASLLMALMIPFLLPRMHERYFYLAELCALAYAALHPRRFPVALMVLLASLNAYFNFLQEYAFLPLWGGSLIILGVLCYLSLRLMTDLGSSTLSLAPGRDPSNPIHTTERSLPHGKNDGTDGKAQEHPGL